MAKSGHFDVHQHIYKRVYNWFPDFDELFDEESFYLTAIGVVILSILVCFLLSRKITLTEADI